jgi:UDP-N-acetylmuramoyl-tripeptide--D-alanyl-D-alanine ligase
MREWAPERVAAAAGARSLAATAVSDGPRRVTIDSREAGPGDLFVGLAGARHDGGRFAAQALAAGAWGVLTTFEHADAARCAPPGVLLAAEDPLGALQSLARTWRRELGCRVIGVTGSTGKTSTKDILAAVLAPARRTAASRANLNTEVGVPLAILEAPAGTEVLVLELAMRGAGQIAELAAIAEPDVGVVVNIGPVHLELLGTIEAVAAAKAELIAALPPGATAVVPADEPLLRPHLRADLEIVTFGEDGDVRPAGTGDDGTLRIEARGRALELIPSFRQAYNWTNLLAATAAALAVGVVPSGRVEVAFSALRGERVDLPGGATLINDCYNANPVSMRAALDDLAAQAAERRIAVLGDMLELGPQAERFHREVGRHARDVGVDLVVAVGPLGPRVLEGFGGEGRSAGDAAEAAAVLSALLAPGDAVLVKGSRGIGLEAVAEALTADGAGGPNH